MFPKIVSPSISMITEMPADWRVVRCLSRQGLIFYNSEAPSPMWLDMLFYRNIPYGF
jgi:hypothetical protein